MAILRYSASADTTISNAFKSTLADRGTSANMGESDVLEIFSIYAQTVDSNDNATLENSRILIKFPVEQIYLDRAADKIPASGNVSFFAKFYNARHGQTVPKRVKYTLKPITKAWTEGFGLDMEEYKDEGAASWLSASSDSTGFVEWAAEGGDLSSYYNREAYLEKGIEDLEFDVSTLVEEWIKGEHTASGATANQAVDCLHLETLVADDSFKVNVPVTDTLGTGLDVTIVAKSSADFAATPGADEIWWNRDFLSNAVWDSIIVFLINGTIYPYVKYGANVVNGTTEGVRGLSAVEGTAEYKVTLTVDAVGIPGNGKVTVADVVGTTIVQEGNLSNGGSKIAGGTGLKNYGVGVMLSSDYEDGSEARSFFTKKMFARNSEFFFKRPVIEARWNSSILDDRGRFHASSSMSTGVNNLYSLYLYVNIPSPSLSSRQDLPTIDGDPASPVEAGGSSTPGVWESQVYVKLYDAAGDGNLLTPVGPSYRPVYNAPAGANYVTGGWSATGIYSASFALDTTLTTVYDRWYSATGSGGATDVICYHTGSFAVKTLKGFSNNTQVSYVTSITNLRDTYSQNESARLRLATRNKNWSPTIYTVAQNTAENLIIPKMYYRIVRAIDNLEIIRYGTGSSGDASTGVTRTLHESRLSYDESGSYFDLDMSLFEPGYAYKINFVHKLSNSYYKLPDSFKFRVE